MYTVQCTLVANFFKVLKRAQPTLLQKYSDPLMAIGHDQTQFEIPVVDHIVDKTMDGLNLRNPVATDLLTKGIWFFNLFAITSFLISIITLFRSINRRNF